MQTSDAHNMNVTDAAQTVQNSDADLSTAQFPFTQHNVTITYANTVIWYKQLIIPNCLTTIIVAALSYSYPDLTLTNYSNCVNLLK